MPVQRPEYDTSESYWGSAGPRILSYTELAHCNSHAISVARKHIIVVMLSALAPITHDRFNQFIKARYRESGSDSAAASMILFEIAISINEEEREARTDSGEGSINYFDRLIEEYHESAEHSTQSLIEGPTFGVPSME
jgi:hypothetical protein